MRTAYSLEMVEELEKQLQLSLRPVHPDQEFVNNLQSRLSNPVTMRVERRQSTAFSMLLVSFSLLSGVVLIWLLRQLRAA